MASKSLSGLESLVDQIPNLTDGEPQQQQLQLQQQQQQQQQQQHALHVHHQAVSNSFSHYTASQPSYSYQSSSFGHYAPHYSTPGTSSGATNPYSQGTINILFCSCLRKQTLNYSLMMQNRCTGTWIQRSIGLLVTPVFWADCFTDERQLTPPQPELFSLLELRPGVRSAPPRGCSQCILSLPGHEQ